MITEQAAWFALRVRTRFERTVLLSLQQRGYEAYLPIQNHVRHWSDRDKIVGSPLFPGYVFARFDVGRRLPILTIPGMNYIAGIGKTPVPIPDREIDSLKTVLRSGRPAGTCPYLRTGQSVRIVEGPFAGMEGILLDVRNQRKLVVSIELLLRSVAVEIFEDAIESVHTPSYLGTTMKPPAMGPPLRASANHPLL
jgi:transcription termination/antitermination protein NusG